jgi:hypothetical protein
MFDHNLAQVVASAGKCHEFLTWLEEAYDVSIGFWISLESYGSGPPVFWLYAGGSGAVFDHPRYAGLVHRSRVLESLENSLSESCWQILMQLDAEMSAIAVPRIARRSY